MASPNSTVYNNAVSAANIIGQALNIDPSVIYGQFVAENGAGLTGTGAQQNNFGNLMPNGNLASYNTPQDFAQAYISTIANNFPGAINSGSNVSQFVNALQYGKNGYQYQTGTPWGAYDNNIAQASAAYSGIDQNAMPDNSTASQVANSVNNGDIAGANTVDAGSPANIGNAITDFVKAEAKNGAFILLGVILVIFALLSHKQTVINLVKGKA